MLTVVKKYKNKYESLISDSYRKNIKYRRIYLWELILQKCLKMRNQGLLLP